MLFMAGTLWSWSIDFTNWVTFHGSLEGQKILGGVLDITIWASSPLSPSVFNGHASQIEDECGKEDKVMCSWEAILFPNSSTSRRHQMVMNSQCKYVVEKHANVLTLSLMGGRRHLHQESSPIALLKLIAFVPYLSTVYIICWHGTLHVTNRWHNMTLVSSVR